MRTRSSAVTRTADGLCDVNLCGAVGIYVDVNIIARAAPKGKPARIAERTTRERLCFEFQKRPSNPVTAPAVLAQRRLDVYVATGLIGGLTCRAHVDRGKCGTQSSRC